MIKISGILALILASSLYAEATSYVEAPPGKESKPLAQREITYNGYEIPISRHGEEKVYIEALDCITKSITSGDFYGKRWNELYQGYSFVKIPKDIKITHAMYTGQFKEYSVVLGDSEFVYTVTLTKNGDCHIENDEFI